MAENQKQSSGDSSVNIQAEQIVLGASYGEIRQIAKDVFDASFYRLAKVAADTAKKRAGDLTESFLQQLAERNPNAAASANDPDFQYTLFSAQKEFARSGDNDLCEVLVDILVDRATEDKKTIKQIVLNESIKTAPKLTPSQWDILSLVFVTKYVGFPWITHIGDIPKAVLKFYVPLVQSLPAKRVSCQHLEYAGCGALGVGELPIENVWQLQYGGLFQKGFTQEEVKPIIAEDTILSQVCIKCPADETKLQFNVLNAEKLREQLQSNGISEKQHIDKTIKFYNKHRSTQQELKDFLISIHPTMAELFARWKESGMQNLTLTSVGMAIAHANLRRRTGLTADLGIWIN